MGTSRDYMVYSTSRLVQRQAEIGGSHDGDLLGH